MLSGKVILGSWQPNDHAIRSNSPIRFSWESIGESVKTESPAKKDPAAVALGRKGGLARAAALPAKKRTQIAAKGAKARWGKKDK